MISKELQESLEAGWTRVGTTIITSEGVMLIPSEELATLIVAVPKMVNALHLVRGQIKRSQGEDDALGLVKHITEVLRAAGLED